MLKIAFSSFWDFKFFRSGCHQITREARDFGDLV